MRFRTVILGLSCLLLATASHVLADNTTVVARLNGIGPMQLGGSRRVVLSFESVKGQRLLIGVTNVNETISKADPDPKLLDQYKTLEPGDIVKVTYYKSDDKGLLLVSIESYPMLPGMELPNAFVFKEMYDHTDNQKTQTLVDAKKFDDVITFGLPLKKDASGSMAPDPDLVAALGQLKEGQVVLIDATSGSPHPILKSIEIYNEPRTGTIKSIKLAELDEHKTTEAEIDVDGTPVTVYVPGHLDGKRWIVDSKVQSLLRRFKTGSLVSFRTIDENGNALLRDIKAAPKPAAPDNAAAGK